MDACDRLAESKYGFRQPFLRSADSESASFPLDSTLAEDVLQKNPSRPFEKRVYIMLVANAHERIALIRQSEPAVPASGQTYRKCVSIGKAELRLQHQLTVSPLRHPHVLAQLSAQQVLERVRIETHDKTASR